MRRTYKIMASAVHSSPILKVGTFMSLGIGEVRSTADAHSRSV